MKIATSPINWNNEDVPDYRPWLPYPKILDEIQRAGYRATEWSQSLPKDPVQLKEDLGARGMEMVGAFVAVDLKDPGKHPEAMAQALEKARFLQALGAGYLVVADPGDETRRKVAGAVPEALALSSEALSALARGLEELADRVGELGLRLVFHPHAGTYVETPEEVSRVLEATDEARVGLCLDTGHLMYGGADPLEFLHRYGERVWYVHLKDVDGRLLGEARGRGFLEALRRFIFVPLGTGVAHIPEVVSALAKRGFSGWLVLEQDTTPIDPTETAVRNRLYVEELLGRYGQV